MNATHTYIYTVYIVSTTPSAYLSLSLNYTQVQKIMENFHYGNPQPIIFYLTWDEAKQLRSCTKYVYGCTYQLHVGQW